MEWTELLIETLKLALGPALVGAIMWRKMKAAENKDAEERRKQERRDDLGSQDTFRRDILQELGTLRSKYDKLLLEHADLQGKFMVLEQELRTKITLFESAHQDLPIPMWLKGPDGVMLSLNKEYEKTFLLPMDITGDQYIGSTDYEIWPKEIADEYKVNDNSVWISGKKFIGLESVATPKGKQKWLIIKYVRYSGRIKIGISGIAFPESMIDDKLLEEIHNRGSVQQIN